MTVRELLLEGTARLRRGGIDTPYLDAAVLLAYCMGMEKERLFASLLAEPSGRVVSNFHDCLEKRLSGFPVSYIRRKKEFYGRDFYVDHRVLVPRPETEHVVEAVLEIASVLRAGAGRGPASPLSVHDCCTGSGCIAITLGLEDPDLEVSASDVSTDALEVFALNCNRLLGRQLPALQSDMLAGLECSRTGRFDIVVCNPPYLSSREYEALERRGWPEPRVALEAGADGLAACRKLAREAVDCLGPYGYLVCEIGVNQSDAVREIFVTSGYHVAEIRKDLAGNERVALAQPKSQDG